MGQNSTQKAEISATCNELVLLLVRSKTRKLFEDSNIWNSELDWHRPCAVLCVLKKSAIICGLLLILLICGRLYLPFYVKNQINEVLYDLEDYSGSVESVSLRLVRGGVGIEGLKVYENIQESGPPLIDVHQGGIEWKWSSLLRGRFWGEIQIDGVEVNYVSRDRVDKPERFNLAAFLHELIPFQLDLRINRGTIHFLNHDTQPVIDVMFTNVGIQVRDLTNKVWEDGTLPTSVDINGEIGGGIVRGVMRANLMRSVPDFEVQLEVEDVDIVEFNDVAEAYGKFEFNRGFLNVYSEAAAQNAMLRGYVKVTAEDVEITPSDEDASPIRKFYEWILDGAASLLESKEEDQLATRVDFEGRIDNPEVSVWQAVWNLLRNGFVEGFSKGIDHELDIGQ